MQKQDFEKMSLPEGPGVYIFKGEKGEILYIGKAVNLKERVASYFQDEVRLLKERGEHIASMVKKTKRLEFKTTKTNAEAIILEANLIKECQPKYNTKEKSAKSFNFLVVTNENFPRVLVVRGRDLSLKWSDKDIKYIFGPFTESSLLRKLLKIVREIFPFRDKCKVWEGAPARPPKPCFSAPLGLCPGACTGKISKKDYAKNIKNIKEFFEGKKEKILKELKKEMQKEAERQNFEEAAKIRDKIFALENIKELALIEEIYKTQSAGANLNLKRVEGYDVAHLSGKHRVGVMVAFTESGFEKSSYRVFNIKTEKEGDTDALCELLERRFKHKEWKAPDLLVIDGGVAQLRVAKRVLKEYKLDIPVVSVVKNERHKPKKILGPKKISELYKNTILKVNAEAHRFALSAHRKRRDRLG